MTYHTFVGRAGHLVWNWIVFFTKRETANEKIGRGSMMTVLGSTKKQVYIKCNISERYE